jgi:FkbM family methyltransferase
VQLQRLLLGAYRVMGPRLLATAAGRRAFVGAYFLYKRWVEDPFARLSRRRPELFRGGHVLDVGANVGYTATVFAGAVDPGRQVHAFEPERRNFAMLEEVVTRRGLVGRVVPVCAAVGATGGAADLWRNNSHHGDHRILTETLRAELGAPLAADRERVPMVALDAYVRANGLEGIAFIKIDVQGFEMEVLRGMQGLLAANPEARMVLEYSPSQMRQLGLDPAALLEDLEVQGFCLTRLARDGTLHDVHRSDLLSLDGPLAYVDLFASRQPPH